MKEKCHACGNLAPLYARKTRRLCEHCVDLQEGTSRIKGIHGPERDGNPINQPNAISTSGLGGRCVWCEARCIPSYRWRDTIIYACGWGCAGFWMDREMERERDREVLEEEDGEAYVRRSLGMST